MVALLKNRRFGWKPDKPDFRDLRFTALKLPRVALPASASVRAKCPKEIDDQGDCGSCTGQSTGAADQFAQMKASPATAFKPSRLQLYYNGRSFEGSTGSDDGAEIRDVIKGLAKYGAAPETLWPYDVRKVAVRPSAIATSAALAHRAIVYRRLAVNLVEMKSCLAAGFPFVAGFTVYESFESDQVARTGTVPLPKPSESALGGHAILVVAYSDRTKRFTCRNSWGAGWGSGGYFTLPYAYLGDSNLADDFWMIQSVA